MSETMVAATYKIDGTLREVQSVPGTGEVEPTGRRIPKVVERTIICEKCDVEAYIEFDFKKITKRGTYGDNPRIDGDPVVLPIDRIYPASKYYG